MKLPVFSLCRKQKSCLRCAHNCAGVLCLCTLPPAAAPAAMPPCRAQALEHTAAPPTPPWSASAAHSCSRSLLAQPPGQTAHASLALAPSLPPARSLAHSRSLPLARSRSLPRLLPPLAVPGSVRPDPKVRMGAPAPAPAPTPTSPAPPAGALPLANGDLFEPVTTSLSLSRAPPLRRRRRCCAHLGTPNRDSVPHALPSPLGPARRARARRFR